ncbi:conserved hypothetical protein [Beggiatoa sp. PS]|nr:conserved hypothetical protein [Beggiatoa sp. PS]
MSNVNSLDYGPLKGLIGLWKGEKGLDVAPKSTGTAENPYYETIAYTAIGDVTNAESQVLSVVRYQQVVSHQSNDEVFHDETGYWMWDPKSKIVMHSLVIPRGVCVLAGGEYKGPTSSEQVEIEVVANINDENWGIIQSPFMQKNARTTAFRHKLTLKDDRLSYSETTLLEIYGKTFEHTDQNELIRQ